MLDPPARPLRTPSGASPRRVRIARPRRAASRGEPADRRARPDELLRCGDLTIDVPAHQAFVGDAPLALSHLQFVLLVHLARRVDRVVPASELEAVAAAVGPVHSRTITSAVSRLRRHLGHGPLRPSIVASRARGYLLRQPAVRLRRA